MPLGLLGTKVGMTQIYDNAGKIAPVTIIQLGPCPVLQVRTQQRDGYDAIQLGYAEQKPKLVNKALLGQFTKRGLKPFRVLHEVRVEDGSKFEIGQTFTVDLLKEVAWVDVMGTSKGKGFQGVMKRHNSKGGPNGHGSMFHRAPGSMGASSTPSRTLKARKLPGQMGNVRTTTQKLKVVAIDSEKGLLLLRGAVPGGKRAIVFINKSKKSK